MRTMIKIILAIFIVAALVTLGFAIGGYFFFRNGGDSSLSIFNYSNASSYRKGDGAIREKVDSLDINWFNGDIEVVEWNESYVELKEKVVEGTMDDDLQLRWKVEGGELKVQYAKAGKKLDLSDFKKTLTVKVPASRSLKDLKIDVVSADSTVTLEELTDLDWKSVNGNLNADIPSLYDVDMDTVNGEVNLRVSSSIPSDLEFDCVNGGLTLSIPADSSFTFTVESLNGDFRCDFPVKMEGKGKYVSGNGKNRYKAESVNGNISVKAI